MQLKMRALRRNRIRSIEDITHLDLEGKHDVESSKTLERQFYLESQISEIRKRVRRRTSELGDSLRSDNTNQQIIYQLKEDLKELQVKERLKYIITRVNEDARQKLFDSENFASLFSKRTKCNAVVMSVDIRRSTELMLTAVSSEIYAEFITTLSEKLSDCITDNFGIYEKFTGDGVLAFFPDFYSGDDAIFFALKTADQCHAIFVDHFEQYNMFFSLELSQTGLGIGIDTGKISLATINGDLSIVGAPVVYACRYASAPAGKTFLTERASGLSVYSQNTDIVFKQVSISIKHEGELLAYEITKKGNFPALRKPDWDRLTELFS